MSRDRGNRAEFTASDRGINAEFTASDKVFGRLVFDKFSIDPVLVMNQMHKVIIVVRYDFVYVFVCRRRVFFIFGVLLFCRKVRLECRGVRSGTDVRQDDGQKDEAVEKTEKNNAEEHFEERLEGEGKGEGEGLREIDRGEMI